MGPQVQPKCFRHAQHMRNNWELRKRGYLIRFGHTEALLLKKKDIKRPFFPPCRYWPICEHCSLFTDHWTVSLLVAKSKDAKREGFCSPLSWFYFYRFLFLQIENLSPTERNQEKRWITLECLRNFIPCTKWQKMLPIWWCPSQGNKKYIESSWGSWEIYISSWD